MDLLFLKKYDGESLYDLSRDIGEAFDGASNPAILEIPLNRDGFQKGTFTVRIEWDSE